MRKVSESWWLMLLKVALYALGTAIAFYPLSPWPVVLTATLGATFGALAAGILARTSLPKGLLLSLGPFMILLGVLSDFIIQHSYFASGRLGVEGTLLVGEVCLISLTILGITFGLRLMASYWSSMALIEALLFVSFFAIQLAIHQNFSIHKPRTLSDLSWTLGIHPLLMLILMGTLLFCLACLFLLRGKRFWRMLLQISLIIVVATGAWLYFKDQKIDLFPKENSFGMIGTEEDSPFRGMKPGGGNSKGEADSKNGKEGPAQTSEGKNSPDGKQGQDSSSSGSKSQGQDSSSQPTENDPEAMPFKNNYSPQHANLPVAIVQFLADYQGSQPYHYFRQTAFSQYNGYRLTQSASDQDLLSFSEPQNNSSRKKELQTSKDKMAIPTQVFLIRSHTRPFALIDPKIFSPIPNPNPRYFQSAYEIQSLAPLLPYSELLEPKPQLPQWGNQKMSQYLELPPDERYGNMAQSIKEQIPSAYRDNPLAQALAISYYLGKTGYYSLKSDHTGMKDPVASFLFGNRTGYCIHFSHAAVYLARSLGIPARVAAGYAVPTSRGQKGPDLLVMERDAHAWPEVFLEPLGWVVVDVPIENYLDPPLPEPSQSLQNELGQIARQPDDLFQEMLRQADSIQRPWLDWIKKFLVILVKALLLFVILLIATGYFYKIYRLIGWRLPVNSKRWVRAYRSASDRLIFYGYRRNFGESREIFSLRAQSLSPNFQDLTWKVVEEKLGRKKNYTPEELRTLIKKVLKEIKKGKKNTVYFLQIINPFSWILSH